MSAEHRSRPLLEEQGLNGAGPQPSRHVVPVRVPGGLAFWSRGEIARVRQERGTGRLEVLHVSGRLGHRPGPLDSVAGPPWVALAGGALVHPDHAGPDGVPAPADPAPGPGQEVRELPGGWGQPVDAGSGLPPAAEEPAEEEIPGLGVRPGEVRRLEAEDRVTTWFTDRGEIRGTIGQGNLEARRHPDMVKAGHGLYVNGRRIREIRNPSGEKHFYLEMDDGFQAPLGQTGPYPMWRTLAEDLGLPHLYFLEPRPETARVLEHEGLRDWPRLLLDMDEEFLRAEFAENPRRLIGNAVLQVARTLSAGNPADYGFDHRGMWYLLIVQLLHRAGLAGAADAVAGEPLGWETTLDELEWLARDRKASLYKLYEGILTAFVGEYRLFDYRGLGFSEARPELRFLGTRHPEVVLVAEKGTLLRSVRELVRLFGCSAIVLGGQPSYLAMEFFSEALGPLLGGRPIRQIDFCDHDPDGYNIGKSVSRHFGRFGLDVESRGRLIRPERFTEEEIRRYALPLHPGSEAIRRKIENWIAETGGIGGLGLGLHADLLRPLSRVIQAFREESGLEVEVGGS